MKIGILSDSHDRLDKIKKAVRFFNDEKCETVFHGGDFIAPFAYKALHGLEAPMIAVFGNNDGETAGLGKALRSRDQLCKGPFAFELAAKRFLLLHEPELLNDFSACGHYDFIIYGHTHQRLLKAGPSMIINPGECCGYLTGFSSVALLDTETRQLDFHDL